MPTLRLAACAAVAVAVAGCGGYVGERPVDGARRPVSTTSSTPLQIPPVEAMINGIPRANPTVSLGASSTQAATSPGAAPNTCRTRSAVGLAVPAKIRGQVTSLRVTLTQGAITHAAWTADDLNDRRGLPLVPGVVVDGDTYWFFLGGVTARDAALRGSWRAKPRATLLVEGLAGDGRAVYQQRRSFAFTSTRPDGQACAPVLSYVTALSAQDQVGVPR